MRVRKIKKLILLTIFNSIQGIKQVEANDENNSYT